MSTRRPSDSISRRCPDCKIVKGLCFCSDRINIDTKTQVIFLMHHREKHLTTNTATMAQKILNNSELLMYGLKDQPLKIDFKSDIKYFFLYPSEDATLIDQIDFDSYPNKSLIIPDGSWRQAKKMHAHSPDFKNIECISIKNTPVSLYLLKHEHQAHYLSTYEACAWALKYLEGDLGESVYSSLKSQFVNFILRNLIARSCYDPQKNFAQMKQSFLNKADYFKDYFKLDPVAFREFLAQL